MMRQLCSVFAAFPPLFLLLVAPALVAHAVPAAPAGLEAAFNALAEYDFGASREPLKQIADAVHAAAGSEQGALVGEFEAALAAVFDTNASLEAKRFVCRLLGEIGGAASVPALAPLLAEDAMRSSAMTALETIQDDAATDALSAALEKLAPEHQPAL